MLNNMAPSISTILDGYLFVGNRDAARDTATLTRLGIDTVFCVAREVQVDYPTFIRANYVGWIDNASQKLDLAEMQSLCARIHAAIEGGHRVLIHCAAGRSRSVMLTVAYIMTRFNLTLHEANMYVRSRRPCADMNIAFHSFLYFIEPQLRDANAPSQRIPTCAPSWPASIPVGARLRRCETYA